MISFCCCSRRKIEIIRDVALDVFSDGRGPRDESIPPGLCYKCVLALYLVFQPETPRSASARFRTADSLSPECALTQLTTPRNLKIWHVEKVSFSFSERFDFRGNHAPNNRSARTLRLGSPPLFPMFLHVASFASTISFLSLSFRKCPSPFAFLENTLGSHASGSRGTGTPCLFPGRNHPPDILKSPFHHRGHTFCDGYAHPPSGLVLHAAYRLSSMGPLFTKRFSIRRFGNLDLRSPRANLCVSPQVACFG